MWGSTYSTTAKLGIIWNAMHPGNIKLRGQSYRIDH